VNAALLTRKTIDLATLTSFNPYGDLPDIPVFRNMADVQQVMSELLGHSALEVGSRLEGWAADPEARLTNDERGMTQFRIKTRATVIEVQRSEGEDQLVARDLFDSEAGEFVVFHPTLGLYDEILLFHCYSKEALKLGCRFLNEEFPRLLEFEYRYSGHRRPNGWADPHLRRVPR
jgi:hypothetical protein